jgi:NitT/TauT family transport system substrate-binding protein
MRAETLAGVLRAPAQAESSRVATSQLARLGRGVTSATVALAVLLGLAACTRPDAARTPSGAGTGLAERPSWLPSDTAAAGATPVPSARPFPAISLRIPYTAVSVVNAPLWVAKDAGDFEREGVNVEVEYIATGTTVTQAMVSGELGLAHSGLESLVTAGLAGADVVGLAASTDRFIFRLYGAPELTGLPDLRGKWVAVSRLGTSTDAVVRLLLQRGGLEPDRDVAIVQAGGVPEIFAALESGAVSAGILSPPIIFRAEAAGYSLLADTTETDIPYHQAVLMSTRRYVAANGDAVRRVLRGYVRGVARYKQDKEFAKDVIGKYTQTTDATILEQTWAIQDRVLARVPSIRLQAVQLALDIAGAQNPAAWTRAPGDFTDDRVLRELESSGFVASLYH